MTHPVYITYTVCECSAIGVEFVVFVGGVGVELLGAVEGRCSWLCIKDCQLKASDGSVRSDQDGRRIYAELNGRCQRGRW